MTPVSSLTNVIGQLVATCQANCQQHIYCVKPIWSTLTVLADVLACTCFVIAYARNAMYTVSPKTSTFYFFE